MAADIKNAFEVDALVFCETGAAIFSGVDDPSVAGQEAPVSSRYYRTTGDEYRKTGPLDTDWTLVETGQMVCVPIIMAAGNEEHLPTTGAALNFCLADGTDTILPLVAC